MLVLFHSTQRINYNFVAAEFVDSDRNIAEQMLHLKAHINTILFYNRMYMHCVIQLVLIWRTMLTEESISRQHWTDCVIASNVLQQKAIYSTTVLYCSIPSHPLNIRVMVIVWGLREYYHNRSVLDCVTQCSQSAAVLIGPMDCVCHIWPLRHA